MDNLNNLLAGTGVATTDGMATDLLKKFGLDWTVSKRPLHLPNGKESGFYGIVRDDTETTFATAKDGYEVFSNYEMLDLVNESAGKLGLSLDNGGSFKSGGLVYLQISSGSVTGIGKNNDTIKKNISAINSHDGSTSLRWGSSGTTISCKNTFNRVYSELQSSVKHTRSMRLRIEEIVNQMLGVIKAEESLYKQFYRFAEVGVTQENIVNVNKMVLGVDLNGKVDELTTNKLNSLKRLAESINGEMAQKGNTLWGLFSGITKYTTHQLSGGEQARMQSKYIGAGYNVDNKVFNHFAEIIK